LVFIHVGTSLIVVRSFVRSRRDTSLAPYYRHDDFSNPLCKHGPQYAFGIGAESRRTSVKFPKGYGYRRSNPYEYWGANIHLLRTEHLRGEPRRAVKECNECYYAPGKGCAPRDNGTFACCGDYGESGPLRGKLHSQSQTSSKKLPSAAGSTTTTTTAGGELLSSSSSSLEKARDFLDRASYYGCPVEPGSPLDVKTYRLKYTINYTDYLAVKPAEIGVWTTPDCDTFYGVYENDAEPESLSSTTFDVEDDMEILTMIGHQHVGALNISVFVNDDFLCASTPKYGLTEGLAGDERGYLVEMSACFLKDDDDPDVPDVVLRKGDKLRLDSWYWVGSVDPNLSGHPGGSHLNVMGYMYTIFNRL